MFYSNLVKFYYVGMVLLLGITACETDENYVDTTEYTSINARLSYLAEEDVTYKIQFGDVVLSDTLPDYENDDNSKRFLSNKKYYNINDLTNKLRVWKHIGNDKPAVLELDIELEAKPKEEIKLIQLVSGSPIQLPSQSTLTENDTTKTSVYLIYNNENQLPKVNISIIAVDYMTLRRNGNKLANVPEKFKQEVEMFTLEKGLKSKECKLDLYYYEGEVRKIRAKFFYAIYDANDNSLIQDYNVKKEIEIPYFTSTKVNTINRMMIMQFPYDSEEVPFDEPESIKKLAEEW